MVKAVLLTAREFLGNSLPAGFIILDQCQFKIKKKPPLLSYHEDVLHYQTVSVVFVSGSLPSLYLKSVNMSAHNASHSEM